MSIRPEKHRELADEVVEADLNRPDTLQPAFAGAHGVFLVNSSSLELEGTDEFAEGTAAVRAAKAAGVKHFIWSTLPDVEAISGGQFDVPHFTGKAKVDRVVTEAGFANYTFAIAPFFYQNLAGAMTPQQQADGSTGWALPLDPSVRCIHIGEIRELGTIVAGAFVHPDQAGHGEYLPLVGDFMSFNERSSTCLIDRVTTSPSRRSRPTSSPLSSLELRRSPRCSGTSKRIPTRVRSHATELRSQTK